MRLLLPLCLLAACGVDNNLSGADKDPAGFDSGGTDTVDTETDSVPPPPDEECNGIDDDGDGQVDEDFPDDNTNGRADCLDLTCPALDLGTPGSVSVLPDCQGTSGGGTTEVVDPWRVKEQWRFTAPAADATATSAWSQAVIGNLDDDNGDGQIDEDDSPEVVVTLFGNRAWVVAIDGATGTEKWAYSSGNGHAITAIADVTGDGNPDVITNNSSGYTIALDGAGNVQWTATEMATVLGYYMVSTADLDEDGQPEVISDNLVLDGATGNLLWEMPHSTGECPYLMAAVGDVDDADNDQEIAYCGYLYDSDGTLLWDSGERGTYGMWPVLVQADSDSEAEIGFAGQHWSLWNADGSNIYTVDYPSASKNPGPPCVGDFDGDGVAEVAFPSYMDFVAYELDGTELWSVPMNDTSGLAGCSGYDVNGDGPLEILFADQTTFKIFDGATGATLYTDSNHSSATIFEYPTVADIDHDDHAEIVITNNYGSYPAVVSYEHNGDGWPAAGTTWAVHDFAISNIEPDGTVPQNPENSWEKYNVYRARVAVDDPSTPDLLVEITDVCVMDCTYGPAAVGLQVTNQGGADVNAGAQVALYAQNDTGLALIDVVSLPAIPAGTRADGIEVTVPPAEIGKWGFVAVVDDDGTGVGSVNECDETNNRDDWDDAFCP